MNRNIHSQASEEDNYCTPEAHKTISGAELMLLLCMWWVRLGGPRNASMFQAANHISLPMKGM